MIKVIASDMDGTLLGDDHRIAPETLAAVKRACDAGIRFMVATGRNFPGAMEELKGTDLTCDYVVSSGAEVRNPQQEVVKSTPISIDLCEEVYNTHFLQTDMIIALEQKKKLKMESSSRSAFSAWTEIPVRKLSGSPRSTAGSPETQKGFPISVPWKAAVRRCTRSSFLRRM